MTLEHKSKTHDFARAAFIEFMSAQISCIEEFRQWLCRQHGEEISSEQAAMMWVEHGHAAAFRNRFSPNFEKPVAWK